jgi:hypothetical protein
MAQSCTGRDLLDGKRVEAVTIEQSSCAVYDLGSTLIAMSCGVGYESSWQQVSAGPKYYVEYILLPQRLAQRE